MLIPAMNIIADANTFLVTALEEPEKSLVVSLSNGCELFSPEILHYEIGNALIAMIRRKRLTYAEAKRAYQLTQVVPVKLLKPDLEVSLEIARVGCISEAPCTVLGLVYDAQLYTLHAMDTHIYKDIDSALPFQNKFGKRPHNLESSGVYIYQETPEMVVFKSHD
jgi:predicted nucleic acid-binding protein